MGVDHGGHAQLLGLDAEYRLLCLVSTSREFHLVVFELLLGRSFPSYFLLRSLALGRGFLGYFLSCDFLLSLALLAACSFSSDKSLYLEFEVCLADLLASKFSC